MIDDLMKCMHRLSVAQNLPKPVINQQAPAPTHISTSVPSTTTSSLIQQSPPICSHRGSCGSAHRTSHHQHRHTWRRIGLRHENPFDFSQVFAAEKKKHESHAHKLLELNSLKATAPIASATSSAAASAISAAPIIPPPTPNASTSRTAGTSTTQNRTTPQYRYHSSAEDQQLMLELGSWLMQGKLAHITPAHVLATSPAVRKDLVEKLQVRRVEASSLEEVRVADTTAQTTFSASECKPAYSLPLHEVDIRIADRVTEAGVIDSGSQIVVI